MSPCLTLRLAAPILALWAAAACAAPFDVYYRPSDKAAWTFYGGRETRAAADAAAADLARSTGFATKVFALGEPVGRAAVGPAVRESVTIGARDYVRRPGLGYAPGGYRHGGGWGGGWSGGWGGGWARFPPAPHRLGWPTSWSSGIVTVGRSRITSRNCSPNSIHPQVCWVWR